MVQLLWKTVCHTTPCPLVGIPPRQMKQARTQRLVRAALSTKTKLEAPQCPLPVTGHTLGAQPRSPKGKERWALSKASPRGAAGPFPRWPPVL